MHVLVKQVHYANTAPLSGNNPNDALQAITTSASHHSTPTEYLHIYATILTLIHPRQPKETNQKSEMTLKDRGLERGWGATHGLLTWSSRTDSAHRWSCLAWCPPFFPIQLPTEGLRLISTSSSVSLSSMKQNCITVCFNTFVDLVQWQSYRLSSAWFRPQKCSWRPADPS